MKRHSISSPFLLALLLVAALYIVIFKPNFWEKRNSPSDLTTPDRAELLDRKSDREITGRSLVARPTTIKEIIALGKKFGKSNPLWGIKQLSSFGFDDYETRFFLNSLFEEWSKNSPMEALNYLIQRAADKNSHSFSSYAYFPLNNLMEKEPKKILSLLLKRSFTTSLGKDGLPSQDLTFIKIALGIYVNSDPNSAWSWTIDYLPYNTLTKSVYRSVIQEISFKDPISAIDKISLLESSLPQNSIGVLGLYDQLITAWASFDAESASLWFKESFKDGESKELQDAISSIGSNLLRQSGGSSALSWITEFDDPKLRKKILDDVSYDWATDNLSDANTGELLDFIGSESKSLSIEQVDDTLSFVVSNFSEKQNIDLERWLESQPQSTLKDTIIYSYADRLTNENPSQALELIQQISEPSIRDNSHFQVLYSWFLSEPEATKNWWAENHHRIGDQAKNDLRDSGLSFK